MGWRVIANAMSDEMAASTPYKCAIANKKANNIRLGNENSLTVTSTGPIPNSAPRLQYNTSGSFLTVEVGKNATLDITSNIPSETVPRVTWYDQDGRVITQGDPNKFQFNADKTTLTVKSVNKDTDISCYQCTVANSVGVVHDDGCVNVIMRPLAQQSVNKGDEVDLTVVASTDPLFAPEMTYSWIFKNVTYTDDRVPPHVSYDSVNNRAYINTSGLTDEEFKSIGGLYRRVISHPVETVYVDVSVEAEHVPVAPIEIRVRPAAQQTVKKGDVVDLTVVASTDPLYAPNMTDSWIFKNVNNTDDKAPPYVTYDLVTKRAYIYTSALSNEFKEMAGIYRRVISHPLESRLICLSPVRVPPSIVSPVEPQQLVYSENNRVEVKCSATGQPAPTYKWTWNGNDINSDYITFSTTTGILTIPSLTTREEGLFVCYAKSTFSNGMTATAVSATVEIRVGRVEDFLKRPIEPYSGTEGNYVRIPCDKNLPVYYGPITFKWYTVLGSRNDEVFPDEHKFIDQGGNLHFSYVLKSDERDGSTAYKCAISNIKSNVIRLGNENSLTVTSTGPIPNSAPKLQYSTSVSFLTVEVGKNATLECVFSGYVSSSIPSETVPRVTWYDQDGRAITQGGHYDITSNGRILTIMNVTEDDEKTYRCRGTNSLGADEGNLALNVTSRPIWVHRLESTTVVEGKDAVFHCVTRSAKGEQSPSQPKWALNTNQMGSTYDPNKHQFNADRTTLTVKFVNKNRDISCYQCTVANSVGMVHDDGCVNVIKPIEIKVRPATEQSVMKGDEVDLTVVATTDPLYAPNMTYSWIFKNVSYTDDRVPPYVTFDSVSKRAYISTSGLTDEEFRSIGGIYRRVISHPVETVHVDVSVEAEHVPVGRYKHFNGSCAL
ncbi:hypothetical protein C0Q70_07610 [Pomacea canaliculata]|uniref:Ig-like domain-containing protein n=1 Tax=Pomacea canaliculata TaxID=400727 RepID=A0A2T7PFK2_POMCA|nr:hypothetical protein C0Q70_07610 [Pomacea canaliculata]